jgi:hypothetical protein
LSSIPQRMYEKEKEPTDEDMQKFIGARFAEDWISLKMFLENYSDFSPETVFYGKKYGWTIRYRKSGKTLCSLFPEAGSFTVLIVLGKKEVEKVEEILNELSTAFRKQFNNTEQLHDGRWLWIKMSSVKSLEDIKKLLQVKRKPKGS